MSKLDKHSSIWSLEPHTKAKHEILTRYLQAWFAIMQRYNNRLLFLDGFAGPGVYLEGEPGSPIITLRLLLQHNSFPSWAGTTFNLLFIEPEPARNASLHEQVEMYMEQSGGLPSNVRVILGDEPFENEATSLLESAESRGKQLVPTFAFLDPFGLKGLPLEVVRRLMSSDKCELFLNFAVKNMARFTDDANMESHLDALFGGDVWRETLSIPVGDRGPALLDLYIEQLREACGGELYIWSFRMVSRGQDSYHLVYVTRNLLGLEKMKDAMWAVDPSGSFRFSSRLSDNEITLEDPAASAHLLRDSLAAEFTGRQVPIADVEKFVLVATPYRKAHTRREGLKPLEDEGKIVVTRPGKHGYPEGTTITFA